MKLKIDVDKSTIDGLNSEKKHSDLELKEARDLGHVYEQKCENLIKQVSALSHELSTNKRDMIVFTQSKEEKDQKIDQLRMDLSQANLEVEQLKLKLGSLTIHSEKQ